MEYILNKKLIQVTTMFDAAMLRNSYTKHTDNWFIFEYSTRIIYY